jgi:AraC-like DNA-binding protein
VNQPRASFRNVQLVVASNRENLIFHHDPMAEREVFHHVKNGNPDEMRKAWQRIGSGQYGVFGTLSRKSALRNRKNLAICTITLATRAAIDGGLYWEEAYTLSDLYIQYIEDLQQAREVDDLLLTALADFTERVKKSRAAGVSKHVAICKNYIFNHLYSEIRLEHLAKAVNLSPSYLSGLFRRETGMTISAFIQRERIEEAKRLLLLTNEPVSSISTKLTFHDQTHFGKVFKKHTGLTPRQYRQTGLPAMADAMHRDMRVDHAAHQNES